MTDNIFDVETTALAHVPCAPRESFNLLTDFAAAYPCANRSWIFLVLEKAELPEFICRSLRRIYFVQQHYTSLICRKSRPQFPKARSVRQGCPASGFLFAVAFDAPMLTISAWLPDTGRRSTQVHSPTVFKKVHAAREYDRAPIFALTSKWKEIILKTNGFLAPWRLLNMCATWIVLAKWRNLPPTRNKRPPRPCYATRFKKRNFAKPIATRDSRAFGPVSRHLTAQILLQMCLASRASRPGLAVGLSRCRAGCQDEPDSLSLSRTTMSVLHCTTSSPRFGDTLQSSHGGAICSTTLLPRSF